MTSSPTRRASATTMGPLFLLFIFSSSFTNALSSNGISKIHQMNMDSFFLPSVPWQANCDARKRKFSSLCISSNLVLLASTQRSPSSNNAKKRKSIAMSDSYDQNDDDGTIEWGGEDMPTYQEYKEKLQAFAFLSSIGEGGASQRAQETFDEMLQNYFTEEIEELQPTTEIYNLLIDSYAWSSDEDQQNGGEIAELILGKMENSKEVDVGIANPDVNTYISGESLTFTVFTYMLRIRAIGVKCKYKI